MSAISSTAILYSLRNCPYAIRARLAVYVSGQTVLLRELRLDNKPVELLEASPKGTVPVLVQPSGEVIELSLDIMLWALSRRDPANYLFADKSDRHQEMLSLIDLFDKEFKTCLESYRSAKRYHDADLFTRRADCERFLQILELRLLEHQYLVSDTPSLADLAIIPFIRQFSRVERQWYRQSPYPKVRGWLSGYLQSRMFSKVMMKFPIWSGCNDQVIFKVD
ncbi:glutathione S-transferase [Shewanella schlegeliana]|uniref:Glutathione S-transferase n=1 Tax=Shewanella schlegeliana TaxID=190308 RepID=A0ABS1SXK2_9GAMM|nr:glutathione S-transferase [Shewanella schlegeliana]MBL4913287.1 glutathione S-transferase [Shewanella schlegeliana]MCL1109242.1 glutathione S-transferase [Shewanella schlegeliana]GIU24527.1 glutathione S-transferase [Shewanella schlegeliana]